MSENVSNEETHTIMDTSRGAAAAAGSRHINLGDLTPLASSRYNAWLSHSGGPKSALAELCAFIADQIQSGIANHLHLRLTEDKDTKELYLQIYDDYEFGFENLLMLGELSPMCSTHIRERSDQESSKHGGGTKKAARFLGNNFEIVTRLSNGKFYRMLYDWSEMSSAGWKERGYDITVSETISEERFRNKHLYENGSMLCIGPIFKAYEEAVKNIPSLLGHIYRDIIQEHPECLSFEDVDGSIEIITPAPLPFDAPVCEPYIQTATMEIWDNEGISNSHPTMLVEILHKKRKYSRNEHKMTTMLISKNGNDLKKIFKKVFIEEKNKLKSDKIMRLIDTITIRAISSIYTENDPKKVYCGNTLIYRNGHELTLTSEFSENNAKFITKYHPYFRNVLFEIKYTKQCIGEHFNIGETKWIDHPPKEETPFGKMVCRIHQELARMYKAEIAAVEKKHHEQTAPVASPVEVVAAPPQPPPSVELVVTEQEGATSESASASSFVTASGACSSDESAEPERATRFIRRRHVAFSLKKDDALIMLDQLYENQAIHDEFDKILEELFTEHIDKRSVARTLLVLIDYETKFVFVRELISHGHSTICGSAILDNFYQANTSHE